MRTYLLVLGCILATLILVWLIIMFMFDLHGYISDWNEDRKKRKEKFKDEYVPIDFIHEYMDNLGSNDNIRRLDGETTKNIAWSALVDMLMNWRHKE